MRRITGRIFHAPDIAENRELISDHLSTEEKPCGMLSCTKRHYDAWNYVIFAES